MTLEGLSLAVSIKQKRSFCHRELLLMAAGSLLLLIVLLLSLYKLEERLDMEAFCSVFNY